MKSFLRTAAYRLTSKRINEDKLDVAEISLKQNEVSYFSLSTNTVISFNHGGNTFYFRECPRVYAFRDYYIEAINAFFQGLGHQGISKEHFKQEIPIRLEFSETETARFKSYIGAKTESKGFIKALSQADKVAAGLGFSIWEKQAYDQSFFESFGIGDLERELYDIAVYFLWNMRAVASNYRTLKIVHSKRYSYFAAVRSVASKITAEEIGLGDMISDVRFCRISLDNGKVLFGVLSTAAPGNRMADIKPQAHCSLQKALTDLNFLDVLCYQPDHGRNNYNVQNKNGLYSVCAFDNDNPRSFFLMPQINASLSGCDAFVGNNGLILRPHLSQSTADSLIGADIAQLKQRLKPYLNVLQIQALCIRIKKMKKAIQKTQSENSRFLISDGDWDDSTVQEELSGKYGTSYFSCLFK